MNCDAATDTVGGVDAPDGGPADAAAETAVGAEAQAVDGAGVDRPVPADVRGADEAVDEVGAPDAAEPSSYDGAAERTDAVSGPTCPTDITAPIPSPLCTADREPGDAKVSAADRAQLEVAAGPVRVIVMVQGGAILCPIPDCSVPPCPVAADYTEYWTAQNLASQQCVRAFIEDLGGTSAPDSFYFVNAFVATLTWAQVESVATHPHVVYIELDERGTPPP